MQVKQYLKQQTYIDKYIHILHTYIYEMYIYIYYVYTTNI